VLIELKIALSETRSDEEDIAWPWLERLFRSLLLEPQTFHEIIEIDRNALGGIESFLIAFSIRPVVNENPSTCNTTCCMPIL